MLVRYWTLGEATVRNAAFPYYLVLNSANDHGAECGVELPSCSNELETFEHTRNRRTRGVSVLYATESRSAVQNAASILFSCCLAMAGSV